MKKNEVKIGTTYRVKVSGKLADVRITGESRYGGWDAVNVATKRKVRIKSPQRLRGLAQPRPAKRHVVKSFDDLKPDEAAKATDGVAALKTAAKVASKVLGIPVGVVGSKKPAGDAKAAPGGAGAKKDAKVAKDATSAKKRATGERGATQRGLSGLDAAAQVLAAAGEPLNTKTMVERMLAQGLWKTAGKTPAGTIHAAIIREIAAKGADARFRKTERGKFEAVK